MIVKDGDTSEYIGWVLLNSSLATYTIKIGSDNMVDINSLRVDSLIQEMNNNLKTLNESVVKERLSNLSAIEFSNEFQKLISYNVQIYNNKNTSIIRNDKDDSKSPRSFLNELNDIGWDKILHIDSNMMNVHFCVYDDMNRKHIFELKLSANYPQSPPTITAHLPIKITFDWIPGSSKLKDIYDTVSKNLMQFQDYFLVLDAIDNNTRVVEPSRPTYAISHRRIVIEKTCSIIIDIDWHDPFVLPEIRFLGSTNKVEELRRNYGKNLASWDNSSGALFKKNLENLLEVVLPEKISKDNNNQEISFFIECGICYSSSAVDDSNSSCTTNIGRGSTTSGSTPDQVCPNPKCSRMYHYSCLVSWLQSLPTTRNSFNTMFGACPYCSDTISITIHQGR